MKVKVVTGECLYCHQTTEIAHIETPNLEIYQCGECQKVWMMFEDQIDRMLRSLEKGPDTDDENNLCPYCYRILQPDYEDWKMVCKDPTCGYSRKLPGLSPQQEKDKKEYLDLRTTIFKYTSKGETPPAKTTVRYNKLKAQYERVRQYE